MHGGGGKAAAEARAMTAVAAAVDGVSSPSNCTTIFSGILCARFSESSFRQIQPREASPRNNAAETFTRTMRYLKPSFGIQSPLDALAAGR